MLRCSERPVSSTVIWDLNLGPPDSKIHQATLPPIINSINSEVNISLEKQMVHKDPIFMWNYFSKFTILYFLHVEVSKTHPFCYMNKLEKKGEQKHTNKNRVEPLKFQEVVSLLARYQSMLQKIFPISYFLHFRYLLPKCFIPSPCLDLCPCYWLLFVLIFILDYSDHLIFRLHFKTSTNISIYFLILSN